MKNSTKLILAAAIFAGSLSSSVAAEPRAEALPSVTDHTCNKPCLKSLLDTFAAAMTAHDPSRLPMAKSVKFTENGKALAIGDGFWKTAGRIKFRLDLLDPESQSAAMETVFEENGQLALYFVRLKTAAGKVTEIETILLRKGNMELFAPELLTEVSANFVKPIPKGERMSRAQLIAAADAYFESVGTEGTPSYKRPPVVDGTVRFENGVQTVNPTAKGGHTVAHEFDNALFKGNIVTDRRYPMVDVEQGVVLGLSVWRATPGYELRGGHWPNDLLLMEYFKVEQGVITEIHAVMNEVPTGSSDGWSPTASVQR